MGPHDKRVLVHLGVVVLADARGHETELVVEGLGAHVRHPHLQGQVLRRTLPRLAGELEQQPARDAVALPFRGDADVGHVRLADDDHHARVADDGFAHAGHVVGPRRRLGDLAHVQP